MGKAMQISAAYPRWPWSDLIDALLPNGRFLDTQVAPFKQSLNPVGVPIQSYLGGLYLLGQISGYYCGGAPASSPCTDTRGRTSHQNSRTSQAGQPLSPMAKAALNGIYLYNDAYAIAVLHGHSTPGAAADPERMDRRPLPARAGAPDLQLRSLRVRQELPGQPPVRRPGPQPRLEQARHQPLLLRPGVAGSSPPPEGRRQGAPAPGSVTAFTQTCPQHRRPTAGRSRPPAGARSRRATFTFGGPGHARPSPPPAGAPRWRRRSTRSPGTTDSCKTISKTNEPNVATYAAQGHEELHDARAARRSAATIAATGQFGQIDARLWDISPGRHPAADHPRRLQPEGRTSPARSHSSSTATATASPPGHTVQLELLGTDSPYYQAGNFPVSINVSKLTVSLPTKWRATASRPRARARVA